MYSERGNLTAHSQKFSVFESVISRMCPLGKIGSEANAFGKPKDKLTEPQLLGDRSSSQGKHVMNTVKPMYEWNDINWAKVQKNVFKLQKRIYQASERGDVKTVRQLQRLLTQSRNAKLLAVRQVTQNHRSKNTAKIDGIQRLRNYQKLQMALNLKWDGKAESSQRVWIPQPGKEEKRPLGIPTMKDRAKQALAKLALEPEWEAKFESHSYGFRPGRSVHDAITAIRGEIDNMPKYVLDADLEKGFDNINHDKLLKKLNLPPFLRRQVRTWLKAGVMNSDQRFSREEELLSGGVLSPLLANVALHGLENLIQEKLHQRVENRVCVIRYADDFVILDSNLEVIKDAKTITAEFLAEMGLKLSEKTTQITHSLDKFEGQVGFDFLGFNHRSYRKCEKRSGNVSPTERKRGYKTFIKPSKDAIKAHFRKVDEVLKKLKNGTQEQVIKALNPMIQGWTNDYSCVNSDRTFNDMDSVMFQKLRGWAMFRKANHQNNTEVISKYWGINRGKGWTFLTPDNAYILRKYRERKRSGYDIQHKQRYPMVTK